MSACMLIAHKEHKNTIQVYFTVMAHVIKPPLHIPEYSGRAPNQQGADSPRQIGIFGVLLGFVVTLSREEPRWSYTFPVVLTQNHHESPPPPPTQHDLTTNLPQRAKNAPRMRPLKFESCLSVPNERRLDKNVPRLRPDVADGATNSADSARLCPDWPPNHQREYFSPVGPSEPRVNHWAPTYPTALRSTPNEPRFLQTLPRRSHESCRISLIRGSVPKTLKVFGASYRPAKNHQETHHELATVHPEPPRLCYDSPRLTPTHPDSRFVAHSAPDSGMCNWGFI